jgi:hypothetical protein
MAGSTACIWDDVSEPPATKIGNNQKKYSKIQLMLKKEKKVTVIFFDI